MKSLFKDLQKSHMKQLKAEGRGPEGEGAASRPHSKGFIKDSLVKVEVEEKWEEPHRAKLKVCDIECSIVEPSLCLQRCAIHLVVRFQPGGHAYSIPTSLFLQDVRMDICSVNLCRS